MGVGVGAQAVLRAPSAFISKCNSKGVPPGALPLQIPVWESGYAGSWRRPSGHMKGASLPSHHLGREAGMGVLRAPGRR